MRVCLLLTFALGVSLVPLRAQAQACVEHVRALIDEELPWNFGAQLITPGGRGHFGQGRVSLEADPMPFSWSAAAGVRTVEIDTPGGALFPLGPASAEGAFVVVDNNFQDRPALRWETATGTVLAIGTPTDADRFVVVGVTEGGTVFGYAVGASGFAGSYRWTPGSGFVLLTDAYRIDAVSSDGSVRLGVDMEGEPNLPYLWRASVGTWVPLEGFPPQAVSWFASDLSGDGRYVTGWFEYADRTTEAFRWSGGTVSVMPGWTPGSFDGGQAVANDGTVFARRTAPPDFDAEYVRWVGPTLQPLYDVLIESGLDPALVTRYFGMGPPGSGATGGVEAFSDDGRVLVTSGDYQRAVRLDGGCAVGLAGSVLGVGVLGGGTLPGGAETLVSWEVSGLGPADQVTVAWSPDGTTYNSVATVPAIRLEDDEFLGGLYEWTVPNVEADAAYLRLSASGVEELVGPFAIEPDESLTASWVGTIPSPYTEPTAWSIGEAPGPGYTVLFTDADDQYASSVTFFEDAAARAAAINDAAAFDLNETTYTLEAPGTLTVGSMDGLTASLLVQNGALAVGDVELGLAPSPTRATLDVGLDGDRTLLTAGLMTVSRTDSARVYVNEGSTVTLRSGLWVGSEAGSDGLVDVFGGTLQVTDAEFGTRIGDEGRGELWVGAGGVLSLVGPVDVGAAASGSGLLTLSDGASGATLGSLQVGTAGVGGLEVTGGAALASNAVALGVEPGSFGTALVEGAGSRWEVSGPMQVGVEGAALLQVQDGAVFCADAFAYAIGAQGTVQVVGEVVISGTADACPAPEAAAGSGAVSRRAGAVLVAPALALAAGATLAADAVRLEAGGTLGGDGALALPLVNAGTLAPGGAEAPGVFTAASGYAQGAAGRLALDLGGTAPGSGHDQLAVTGTATLGGTLTLALLDGYTPVVGDAYALVMADAVAGAFAAVEAPAGVEVAVAYEEDGVVATVTGVTVSSEDDEARPSALALGTPYPNPIQAGASLTYALPDAGAVRLEVYDALGRRVATLVEGVQPAGTHTVRLDAGALASGVYVARLDADGQALARRFTIVR